MGELLYKAWIWSGTPGNQGADEMYTEIYFPMFALTWLIVFLVGLSSCILNRNNMENPQNWVLPLCGVIPLFAAIGWPLTWGMSVFAVALGIPLLIVVAVPAGLVIGLLRLLPRPANTSGDSDG